MSKLDIILKKISNIENKIDNNFKQETKKFLKPVEDIEYDKKTGRIIRINNWEQNFNIFLIGTEWVGNNFQDSYSSKDDEKLIKNQIKLGLAYISKETCEKAEQEMIKKVAEENKKIGAKC